MLNFYSYLDAFKYFFIINAFSYIFVDLDFLLNYMLAFGHLAALLISKQYLIAMAFALVEYSIEVVLFPELKEHWWLSNIGLVMVLLGELIRKAAIITARRSFTHNIRVYYDAEHELITHGIYR